MDVYESYLLKIGYLQRTAHGSPCGCVRPAGFGAGGVRLGQRERMRACRMPLRAGLARMPTLGPCNLQT